MPVELGEGEYREKWAYTGRRWWKLKGKTTPQLTYVWVTLDEAGVPTETLHGFPKQILDGRLAGIGAIYLITHLPDGRFWSTGSKGLEYHSTLKDTDQIMRWEAEAREAETRARGDRMVQDALDNAEQLDPALDAMAEVYANLAYADRMGWLAYIMERVTRLGAEKLAEKKVRAARETERATGYKKGFADGERAGKRTKAGG